MGLPGESNRQTSALKGALNGTNGKDRMALPLRRKQGDGFQIRIRCSKESLQHRIASQRLMIVQILIPQPDRVHPSNSVPVHAVFIRSTSWHTISSYRHSIYAIKGGFKNGYREKSGSRCRVVLNSFRVILCNRFRMGFFLHGPDSGFFRRGDSPPAEEFLCIVLRKSHSFPSSPEKVPG